MRQTLSTFKAPTENGDENQYHPDCQDNNTVSNCPHKQHNQRKSECEWPETLTWADDRLVDLRHALHNPFFLRCRNSRLTRFVCSLKFFLIRLFVFFCWLLLLLRHLQHLAPILLYG